MRILLYATAVAFAVWLIDRAWRRLRGDLVQTTVLDMLFCCVAIVVFGLTWLEML